MSLLCVLFQADTASRFLYSTHQICHELCVFFLTGLGHSLATSLATPPGYPEEGHSGPTQSPILTALVIHNSVLRKLNVPII